MPTSLAVRSDRQLRILTITTIIPASALMLIFGLCAFQDIPVSGLVPLAMSALLGAKTLAGREISSTLRAGFDVTLAVLILAILGIK